MCKKQKSHKWFSLFQIAVKLYSETGSTETNCNLELMPDWSIMWIKYLYYKGWHMRCSVTEGKFITTLGQAVWGIFLALPLRVGIAWNHYGSSGKSMQEEIFHLCVVEVEWVQGSIFRKGWKPILFTLTSHAHLHCQPVSVRQGARFQHSTPVKCSTK